MRSFLNKPENRKHIRILFAFFSLSVIFAVMIGYQDPYYKQGISLADKQDLSHTDYCILKEGYYCGDDGVNVKCNHHTGFIYYTAPLTDEQAMEKAGFEYIAAESVYCNGADSAQIQKIRPYGNGFLLFYFIIGEA